MGFLKNAIHRWTAPKAGRGIMDPIYWQGAAFPASRLASGEVVTPNTALSVSAVYASVRVLAETISTLPIKIYQTMADGGKRLATEHPLNVPLRLMPNVYQDKVKFWDQGVTHLNLRGDMFAEIISGPRFGAVDELRPIHPDMMKEIKRLENGRLRYIVTEKTGTTRELSQDQVLHISGPLSQDGVRGMSPITAARQGIGLSMAAERYGAKFFANSAMPSVVLTTPPEMNLDDEGIKNLRKSFINQQGGDNQMGVAVMRGGVVATAMTMASRDAQYIETRKFQVSDIARIFRVPPHLIGDLERATFSNIEEMGINFVQYSLVPWLARIELALMIQLMSRQDLEAGFYIKFIVDGLLRGDITSRFSAYEIGINNGIYSPNEVRKFEDLNPREGGDEYVASQNTRPSGGGFGGGGESVASIMADEPKPVAEIEPSVFVADAAKRIANAEIREISKHIKHAEADRQKFDAWVVSYLTGDNHRRYVGMVTEPLGINTSIDIVGKICDPWLWRIANDPMLVMDAWKEDREEQVAVLITEGMSHDDE